MRVGIDISQVVYGTGVSTYTRNLVENLLKYHKDTEYVLFGGSLRRTDDLKQFFNELRGNFEKKKYPLPPYLTNILWNKLHILPIEAFIGKVDVFHSSDWTQPPSSAFKVTTVHDLVPILQPDLAARDMIRNVAKTHRRRLFWVKKEANRIIVPTEETKRGLIKLGFERDKIRVISEAPDPIFKRVSASKIKSVKKKYGLSREHLLSVGVNPRKNTKRIIKAFQKIRKQGQYKDLSLAIIGHPYMEVEETEGVRILGHVSESEKPALFSGAEVLVYPSLYEGFGLPILEAFACNTPVVTSRVGSMREISGDAAVLVNPKSTQSILEGIKEAFNNKDFLVRKGVKIVKTFSWKKTAEKTYNVYKENKLIC